MVDFRASIPEPLQSFANAAAPLHGLIVEVN